MALRLLEGYRPSDLGLDGFEEYRRHPLTDAEVQLEVIEYFITSKKRITAACVPTGLGKSLIAMSVAKFTECRTAILTGTLGLEQQYMRDLEEYGLVNVHGKARYDCQGVTEQPYDCRTGVKAGCKLVGGAGCTYEIYRDESREAATVITNYDYWFNINLRGGIERQGQRAEMPPTGLGPNPIELLICDEAHEADKKLSSFLSIRAYEKDFEGSGLELKEIQSFGESLKDWRKLAVRRAAELSGELDDLDLELTHMAKTGTIKSDHVRYYHELEKRKEKFEKLTTIDEDWVIEKRIGTQWGRMWAFDVKWPGRYNHYLFCSVPKILLMSATLKPHHLRRLGVAKDAFEFREWEPIFPKNRCPVYFLPPYHEVEGEQRAIRITRKTKEADKLEWVRHIDALIDQRLDRRVLVLTTSYNYQKFFMENSKHAGRIIANSNEDPDAPSAQEAFEQFIKATPPVILCSPSFGVGWDFKGDRCEFMIISKVPLKPPPGTSKLAQARYDQDSEYFDQETMSDVEQAKGRLQRSEDDRGEVVIADGTWSWWGPMNQHLASPGFVGSVRRVSGLPKKPEKL